MLDLLTLLQSAWHYFEWGEVGEECRPTEKRDDTKSESHGPQYLDLSEDESNH